MKPHTRTAQTAEMFRPCLDEQLNMKQVYFSNESGSPQTAEWHAWRARGIGASEAAIVAGHYGLISVS